MMSASLVTVRPVALRPEIAVAVVMEVMAVVFKVAVVVASVTIDRKILVHQPRTRQCVLSMERHTTHARTVYGTVATVPYSRRPRAIQHEWIFSHICIEEGGVNILAAKMMERCFIIEKEDSEPDNAVFAGIFGGFLQSLIK